MSTITELLNLLEPDPWRDETGFSEELSASLDQLSLPGTSEAEITAILNKWISRYQPCLFGNLAARQDAITYCIIREEHLLAWDETQLRDFIQDARMRWFARGCRGQSSNFII